MQYLSLGITAVFAASFSNPEAKGQTVPKPNILWITIEDTSPQFIGCYGNKNARTPVIDKLAAEGVRFTNAFSTGTVSSPSRTALITGVKTYCAGTGHHRSKYNLPGFIKGFPYYLKQQGYYTSNNAKTDYNVHNEAGFIEEAWDESSGKAGWWNRKAGQPFFAVFNFLDSHQSRTMTESYDWYQKNVLAALKTEEQIYEDGFEIPPIYHDSPEMRKHHARVYNSLKLTDNKIGEILARLDKEGLRDSTIIFFFADHGEGIPRGKTNGIDFGYRVPFIVWFPDAYKHLSPWGTGGVVANDLVEFTDLAPTVISLAGGQVPAHMNGKTLIGPNRSRPAGHLILSSDRSDNGIDMVRTVTDGRFLYSRNFMPFIPELRYIRYMEISEIKQQMRQDYKNGKMNAFQKSMFGDRPPEYLFDLKNDPWETRNLAGDPKYAPVLEKMRKNLTDEMLSVRDVMLLPEYEIGLMQASTNAYEFRMDDQKFPVAGILEAASLSGFRSKEVADKQINMLKDKNNIVRYWAILGLRSQQSKVLASFKKEIKLSMADSYPPVAITAAAIAYKEYGDKQAEETLKKYCDSNDMNLALMAMNFLLYTSNKQPFIETIKQVHAKPNLIYSVKVACMDFLGSMGLVPNNMENRE